MSEEEAKASKGRLHNFSAGPSALALPVLQAAQKDAMNWQGCGVGVMEMSHRSSQFGQILEETKDDLTQLLSIPDSHTVLFMQGGATTQFSAIPINLVTNTKPAMDFIVTGAWSHKAAQEAEKYGRVNIVAHSRREDGSYCELPAIDQAKFSPVKECAFVYFCGNETVHGVAYNELPTVPEGSILVGDYSSSFLSRPIDVSRFGILYAGAQKNVGPPGVTIVIVRKDLLALDPNSQTHAAFCPTMLNYALLAAKDSMYNTPPTWSIYVAGQTFKWLLHGIGGLESMHEMNNLKSSSLYALLDASDIYEATVTDPAARSTMNIPFRINGGDEEAEAAFLLEAAHEGLVGLKGHRSVGGIRVSLYNAVTWEATQALLEFMKTFEGLFVLSTTPTPSPTA